MNDEFRTKCRKTTAFLVIPADTRSEGKMQMCGIYKRKGCFYVVTESFTDFGIGVCIGAMCKLRTGEPAELGAAIVTCLDASQTGLPELDKETLNQTRKDLYKFTSSRSWSDLVKNSLFASVQRDGVKVTVISHKAGDHTALLPAGPSIACADEEKEIGRAVFRAFEIPLSP